MELKIVLEGPEDIEFAEWHSKGNAIIAGSKDGTVWMWLTQTGQCVQVFAGHDGGVSCGCFTKDGNVVCSGGEDGTVRLWAPVTGKCKHTFEGHFGHEGMVTCLASSSDGDLLLSGESFTFFLPPFLFLSRAHVVCGAHEEANVYSQSHVRLLTIPVT